MFSTAKLGSQFFNMSDFEAICTDLMKDALPDSPPVLDAPTCVLRYAVITALGGVVVIERPVPLCHTLDDFVLAARRVLTAQDRISRYMVDKYVVAENMSTEHGVWLSDLRDWFHMMPSDVVCVTSVQGSCDVLARTHIAWRVALRGGMTCAVWARVSTHLAECKVHLFEQLRAVGIVHDVPLRSVCDVDISLVSQDGFYTPIVSPQQMFCGTVYVPGDFTPSSLPEVVLQHPDMSGDASLSGVFSHFWESSTGKRVRDRSQWDA